MIELKYKTWEEVTIPVYQEICDIAKSGEGDDIFDNREIDILAVLCDSDRESLSNLLLPDYAKLAKSAQFLRKIPFYLPKSIITLNGVDYRVVVDVSKFTLAQYAEYNALRADVSTNIAQIIACLLIPTTAKGYADGYDVADVVKAIEAELPYYKAHGILHFFHKAQSLSLASTLRMESLKMSWMARIAESRAEREKMKNEARQLRKASIYLGRCLLSK